MSTTKPSQNNVVPSVASLVDAATVVVDATRARTFDLLTTDAVGVNRAMGAATGMMDDQIILFRIQQSATGSRTITWNAFYDFGTAGAPTLTATANKRDVVAGRYCAASGKCQMFTIAPGFAP